MRKPNCWRDAWWATPLGVFTVLSTFIAYATWAAFQGQHYRFGPYLSPFYSPELLGSATAWFGPKPCGTQARLIIARCTERSMVKRWLVSRFSTSKT